jgi:hypothetical protein
VKRFLREIPSMRLTTALLALGLVPLVARAQDTVAVPDTSRLVAPLAAPRRGWNDPRTLDLVQRATARRAEQLADTGLVDYQARAHGYLTFLAQLGEGFTEPPQVVKADELGLEVFWKAPDLSKQRIMGRRDTLLLPTDINYHRDHLGIIQNNFPSIIRLGDGDEVADVPHPLSADGLLAYDFAIADSLSIRLPDRTIDVYQVNVRPRDDRLARAVGAVFIDRTEAQVVRMAFSFTRSSYLDKDLEDVSVVLENALVGARFWLPSRQEIEIRRVGTWLDFPARGIIRGRWEICCYQLNRGLSPVLFRGAEIVQAPPSVLRAHKWEGRILDSLPPDVRAPTDEDVARVQEEARALVRAEALARARQTAVAARSASDFVRVNRVEGLALGAGIARRFGGGLSAALTGRWGLDDREAKGQVALGWRRASGAGLRLRAYRAYRDASEEPERSGVVNSLAAQEFGSDYTEPFDARGAMLGVDLGTRLGVRWSVDAGYERQSPLAIVASPANGRYERVIPAWRVRGPRATLAVSRPTALGFWGTELRARAALTGGTYEKRDDAEPFDDGRWFARAWASANLERPFGVRRVVVRATAGSARGEPRLAPQEHFFAGGPVSGPGYGFHELAGRQLGTLRAEWRTPVPFVSLRLGRFGRSPATATLAPFAHAVYVSGAAPFQAARHGWYPAAGVGVQTLFDLLRFDVARGLRDGRWTFSVDVGRDFWSVL